MMGYINERVFPVVEQFKPIKPLALQLKATVGPSDRIGVYRFSRMDSQVYYTQRPVTWLSTPEEIKEFARQTKGHGYVFASESDFNKYLKKSGYPTFTQKAGMLVLKVK
jgi:hypothetical protein